MTYRINGTTVIDSNKNATLNRANVTGSGVVVQAESGFQGTVAGYTTAGIAPPASYNNTIDKFPFASDVNATDVGDFNGVHDSAGVGQSSAISGYASTTGGSIQKFPFASNSNTSTVGSLSASRYRAGGMSSTVSGYTSGGRDGPNVIDKFPFATNANATDVGDLTVGRYYAATQSSLISGYTSGGLVVPGITNTIDKFSFATDGNATDVGDLNGNYYAISQNVGHSSTTHGYSSGGNGPPASGSLSSIRRFSFASDGNSVQTGRYLSLDRYTAAGQSSTVSGYTSGGDIYFPFGSKTNTIDKFPFAINASATDVGDLTVVRGSSSGQQD